MDIRRACCSHRLCRGDVETLPNNKYHYLSDSILLDWNTHILVDSKQPSIRKD